MPGAVAEAERIYEALGGPPKAFMPQQFKNPANPEIHRKTTAEEIWRDTDGKVDILVAGVGTGGTITGGGEVLKAHKPSLQGDRRRTGQQPGHHPGKSKAAPGTSQAAVRHKIQGIGAGFIPDILNVEHHRRSRSGNGRRVFEMARRLAKEEGMLCGISCGAAAFAAVQVAKRPENAGKMIVVVLPDLGERYLSTPFIRRINGFWEGFSKAGTHPKKTTSRRRRTH